MALVSLLEGMPPPGASPPTCFARDSSILLSPFGPAKGCSKWFHNFVWAVQPHFFITLRARPHRTSLSCVALLGVLPRIPFVISEISAAPEAHFQPATALHQRNITGGLNFCGIGFALIKVKSSLRARAKQSSTVSLCPLFPRRRESIITLRPPSQFAIHLCYWCLFGF